MFEVRETARRVAEQSRFVRIDRQASAAFAECMGSLEIVVPPWDAFHHFKGPEEETIAYLLVLDTLNFCFWPAPGTEIWEIEYGGEWSSGYYALALTLKKALESGFPVTDSGYLADLSVDEFRQILSGRGTLQLMDRRLENLRELGKMLAENYQGRAHDLVASSQGSAAALARLLNRSLSSFRDVATYGDETVYFYKRAQLFAADLYGAFEGRGWGEFHDLSDLTAFADYKLPQVLRHAGILEYSKPLAEKVDQKALLEPGGPEEVEIRSNTIRAVEIIREELATRGRNLMAFEIDWLLWSLGQEDRFREKPYHRTITIFY
ncbi:MAG: queuosine salvage family protein [Desulfatiglandales bacterium]